MFDAYRRDVHYLRVSVTDRCNFRCRYCVPPEGAGRLAPGELLSYEELLRLIRVFAGEGITSVRLTGGEPLVRKDLAGFIAGIREVKGIEDLSLTTNGSLLPGLAGRLKAAGLDRVNISLDTVNPERFAALTAGGRIGDTLRGVESALEAGLAPVKLNAVLTGALAADDLAYFVSMVQVYPVAVRFIEYMPVSGRPFAGGMSVEQVKKRLEAAGLGALEPASAKGGGPARYYRLPRARGCFGFITPFSECFCPACNRLRLTADGKLRPCLLSGREIDVKAPLRSGADDAVLAGLFRRAVREKPAGHFWGRAGGQPELVAGM